MDYLRQDLEKEAKAEQQRRIELRKRWESACEKLDKARNASCLAAVQQLKYMDAIAEFLKIQTDIATKL